MTRSCVCQFASLLGYRLDHACILVTQIHAHQLRTQIEVAFARAISEPAALSVGNVQLLPCLLEAPCAVVCLPRNGADLFGCECLCQATIAHCTVLRFGFLQVNVSVGSPGRPC